MQVVRRTGKSCKTVGEPGAVYVFFFLAFRLGICTLCSLSSIFIAFYFAHNRLEVVRFLRASYHRPKLQLIAPKRHFYANENGNNLHRFGGGVRSVGGRGSNSCGRGAGGSGRGRWRQSVVPRRSRNAAVRRRQS